MFGWNVTSRKETKRVSEASGAYDGGVTGALSGIVVGTRVATATGWRDVGALQEGDEVLTFDGGLQPVIAVRRRPIWSGRGPCPSTFWPLLIPAGALENVKPMWIMPRQGVMLESDVAEKVLGDPFALVPASVLVGVRGIEQSYPNDPVEVVTLCFENDQVVFAEQGTLLFCPSGNDLVLAALSGLKSDCLYEMLPEASAKCVASRLGKRGANEHVLEAFRALLNDRLSDCVAAA